VTLREGGSEREVGDHLPHLGVVLGVCVCVCVLLMPAEEVEGQPMVTHCGSRNNQVYASTARYWFLRFLSFLSR
jgi:hypothetical protein